MCMTKLPVGTAFRTTCLHLLCEVCANKSFSNNCFCPICEKRLQAEDVAETIIGVPPGIPMQENSFQAVFQDPSLPAILSNISKVVDITAELVKFVQSQAIYQTKTEEESRNELEEKLETVQREMVICKCLYSTGVR